MPAFQYLALDPQGRQRKGLIAADTARLARQLLRESGLSPLQVTEAAGAELRRHHHLFGARINAADVALVTRQLATLVAAGLPLEEALGTVAQQTPGRRLSALMLALRAKVLEGHSLASALRDFPRIFPELYSATVAAGEQAGHLDVVFERLADYTEARQHLRQKIGLALFYPLLLTLVALLVVAGLLTYVVPQVVQVFSSLHQQLPALTRGLIALSAFLRNYAGWLLLVLALGVLSWWYALRRRAFQRWVHGLLLRLPLLGRLVRGTHSARFTRTFSILLASGVPVLEGLRISAQVIGNVPMREAVEQAALRVKEGASLQQAISSSGYFPPMTVQLIASGESSGRLESMLERAALQQERETETLIAALLAVFEPMLILLMGAVVLVIVLAILLPIFDLNQLVR